MVTQPGIPQQWNGADGEGVLWKVPVPLTSPNSPVVWNDRVFVSGATAEQQVVYCYDALQGDLLWEMAVPVEVGEAEEYEVAEYTGHAASTLATDGVRVYAIFASGNAKFGRQGDFVAAPPECF